MTRIQLLLVDDHILFRESLRRLLASEPDFDVVSDCGTTTEACAIVEQCPVDIILLDFDLAGTDACDCIAAIQRTCYEGRILIVTGSMTASESSMVLKMGASGIFYKHHSPGMLAQAIRHVASGMTWVDQPAMRLMTDDQERRRELRDRGPWTERERQVLQGIFEGLANKEIGAKLGVSESAVKATLQQLFQKTGVRTRSQLVRVALESSFFEGVQENDSTNSGFRLARARKIGEL
jgi:two-component system, NarL family, nitrate/nitrite response regulator NarL